MICRIGIVLLGMGAILEVTPESSGAELFGDKIVVSEDAAQLIDAGEGGGNIQDGAGQERADQDGAGHDEVGRFEEIVYAVRESCHDHWYGNFGFYACPIQEYPPRQRVEGDVCVPPIFKKGGRLCRTNLRTKETTVLVDDPAGSVRDPKVHYDGKTILFSYRKGGQSHFHLYEIQSDGSGLTQLTEGPFNDIEPTYLPDGGIMFCSDRCRRYVNCWRTPVAVLHRCDGDGGNIRMISSNVEHDNTPWVLPDGRVLYMRWEYVDRNQGTFHHLWTTNPDGTAQMVYYGNQRPGYVMIDAKPVPGTNRVVAVFSPGHGRSEHSGYITVVDPNLGPDDPAGTKRLCSDGGLRDPYPVSSSKFLVAKGPDVYLLSDDGKLSLLCRLDMPALALHEPRPLAPRPRERVIPSRVDSRESTGTLVLADIAYGRRMQGVEPGEIDKLLVLETLPKPVNFSGGMWPISAGGTFTLSRVLGTVPVEKDGSAHMELPAMRSLFFVALDRDGRAVKRMRSFVTVQPGETTSCVGCHENRTDTPLADFGGLLAAARRPSRIEPFAEIPDVLDFPRDIQPILDAHCVECHNPDRMEGKIDLCGDHTPIFSRSYWTLTRHGLISDGRNEPNGESRPRSLGSSASRLLDYLEPAHYDVALSEKEKTTIRLWIDSSAPYAGTYAALGSGISTVEFPVDAMKRRCGRCHGETPKSKRRIGGHDTYFRFGGPGPARPLVHTLMHLRDIRAYMGYFKFGQSPTPQSLCNLTRPDKSILLQAPLAKSAGGLQRCGEAVFSDRSDEDYRAMLAAIEAAGARLAVEKRFDMPGFRPNDYYLHYLRRYGILTDLVAKSANLNPYELDRAYWRLFEWKPQSEVVR